MTAGEPESGPEQVLEWLRNQRPSLDWSLSDASQFVRRFHAQLAETADDPSSKLAQRAVALRVLNDMAIGRRAVPVDSSLEARTTSPEPPAVPSPLYRRSIPSKPKTAPTSLGAGADLKSDTQIH